MTNTSDLLASESLLFTVLGVVFSAWYPEISQAAAIKVPTHLEDAGPQRAVVRNALVLKVLPLSIMAALVFLVFLPEAGAILTDAIRDLSHSGTHVLQNYDPTKAAVVLVTLLALFFTIYLTTLTHKLDRLRRHLRVPAAQTGTSSGPTMLGDK